MTQTITALPTPQILQISGADASAFAQAQFSSNLDELPNGHRQWSAWLSAQGRVRAFFHLLRDDDTHLRVVMRGGNAGVLREALTRYVLRAKVALDVDSHSHAFIQWQPADANVNADGRSAFPIQYGSGQSSLALPGDGTRRLVLCADGALAIDADESGDARNENALADINAGLVTLDSALEERFLPNWLGLDALGATSTRKGCYPGQEIVARLHFRGGNKRSLRRIVLDADHLPAPGDSIPRTNAADAIVVCSAWLGEQSAVVLAVLGDSMPASAHVATQP